VQDGRLNRPQFVAFLLPLAACQLILVVFLLGSVAQTPGAERAQMPEPANSTGTNSFPDLNEVFQGRIFENKFDREVFFLRRIREHYPAYWPSLLGANIIATDYEQTPEKLLHFIQELGVAMQTSDDLCAITNLATITSDPAFYANTNAYRLEIQRATAEALLKIGARGAQALAESFSESHYCTDTTSLEVLADVVGKSRVPASKLAQALATTAFTFTATNGGYYPRCTTVSTRNLLLLTDGASIVGIHFNTNEVFADPGRFQAVVDGIAEAHAAVLSTNLAQIATQAAVKLDSLAGTPSPYRDDLQALLTRIRKVIEQLKTPNRAKN
jgi:hypothetical protein